MRNNNKYHILKGESKQKHPNHKPTVLAVLIKTTKATQCFSIGAYKLFFSLFY